MLTAEFQGSNVPFVCRFDANFVHAIVSFCERGIYDYDFAERIPLVDERARHIAQPIYHASLSLILAELRVKFGPEVAFTKFRATIDRLIKGKVGKGKVANMDGKDFMAVVAHVYELPDYHNITKSLRDTLVDFYGIYLEETNFDRTTPFYNAMSEHRQFAGDVYTAQMAVHGPIHEAIKCLRALQLQTNPEAEAQRQGSHPSLDAAIKHEANTATQGHSLPQQILTAEDGATTLLPLKLKKSINHARYFLSNINTMGRDTLCQHVLNAFTMSLRDLDTAQQFAAVASSVYSMDSNGNNHLRHAVVETCIWVIQDEATRLQLEHISCPPQLVQDCRERMANVSTGEQVLKQSAAVFSSIWI